MYYIAYGSNLNQYQMSRRCPDSMAVGIGWLNGYRLAFKGSKSGNYLTVEKAKGHKLPVAVYSISEDDERELDRYEGFPSFYKKASFPVKLEEFPPEKGTVIKGMIYIMREGAEYGIPSSTYYNVCRDGYRDFGFNEKYLQEAFNYTIERIK